MENYILLFVNECTSQNISSGHRHFRHTFKQLKKSVCYENWSVMGCWIQFCQNVSSSLLHWHQWCYTDNIVFLNIFLSAVWFCFNTDGSDKCDVTVCVLAEYIASDALCRVLLKLWELLVLWSLALIHFCLSFNYQTLFKTGVKDDFVIIGPSLMEDPNGLKLEDEKFILWGENIQCSFCVMLSVVFTVAVRVELLHPQGRQLQECCL